MLRSQSLDSFFYGKKKHGQMGFFTPKTKTFWKTAMIERNFDSFIQVPSSKMKHLKVLIREFRSVYHKWLIQVLNVMEGEIWSKFHQFCIAKESGLHPTGSYFLGTMLNCSDVDLVFLAPPSITYEHFSKYFISFLEQHISKTFHLEFNYVENRSDAFIPLVRFICAPFFFDCLFANVSYETFQCFLQEAVPSFLNIPLIATNPSSLIALNSVRALEMLISLIPKTKLVLWKKGICYIMLWARKKNLCSNATGFPSSVSFVIMTVKTFQTYSQISNLIEFLYHFFFMFSTWDWKKNLVDVLPIPHSQVGTKWRSRDEMRVLLPTPPKLNTCKNVTASTLEILRNELQEAYQIVNTIVFEPLLSEYQLCSIFQLLYNRRYFFAEYDHFLKVECTFHYPVEERKVFSPSMKWIAPEPEEVSRIACHIRHEMKSLVVALDREKMVIRAEIYEHPISSFTEKNRIVTSLFLGYQEIYNSGDRLQAIVNQFQMTLSTLMSTCELPNSIFKIEPIHSSSPSILPLRLREIWNQKKRPFRLKSNYSR